MKVTVLMNNDFGLPVARKFNLQMLRSEPAYQCGQHELVIQGKYKGKRKMSAFRNAGRVVIVEGWHEPQSTFNVQPKGELIVFRMIEWNGWLKSAGRRFL